MSVGNPNCSGLPGGDCCRHFHNPLTWNQAFHWIKYTGLIKGPSYKKYYTSHDDSCSGSSCIEGPPVTDSMHYQTEDTLVGCPQ